MASARVNATALVEGQAGGETTANGYLGRLEYFFGATVLDRDLTTPPGGTPAEGATYILAGSGTGAWAGHAAGEMATYISGWKFTTPKGGFSCFIVDEKLPLMYSSVESLWFPLVDQWSATEHWTGKYRGSSKVYAKMFTFSAITIGVTAQAHGITALVLTEPIVAQTSVLTGVGFVLAGPIAPNFGTWVGVILDATNISIDYQGSEGFDIKARVEYCR